MWPSINIKPGDVIGGAAIEEEIGIGGQAWVS